MDRTTIVCIIHLLHIQGSPRADRPIGISDSSSPADMEAMELCTASAVSRSPRFMFQLAPHLLFTGQ
ncbi:hypothetical protein GDO81_025911 [Engystomops pustulosus]|uniref:Uncharacterized protein n=1 Tax=Engystomops pustulosus TaxID=76066 RepID=A0AAV6ZQJ9_ENGPU|nr:hypothetical protein GDO81_025911 [Engystomops pustulosus]